MKRMLCTLLIALLLLCPLLAAHADDEGFVVVPDDVLEPDEEAALEARAEEICAARGVSVCFLYTDDDNGGAALIEETQQLAETQTAAGVGNAVVLALNPSVYYVYAEGTIAEAVFPESVCDSVLWETFRAPKDTVAEKIEAYFDAADQLLVSYTENPSAYVVTTPMQFDVPETVARTDGGKPTLYDSEHLLTDSEAEALSKHLKEIGSRYRCDVIIATVSSLGRKTATEYADDFFDYNGYGYGAVPDANGMTVNGDGILLLLSMEDRDFAISTSGYGITAFTDYGIQMYLESQFLPYLKTNNYNDGFRAFADGCEFLLKTAREGEPFDVFTASEQTANGKPVILDMAGLLTTDQVQTFSQRLKEIGDRYQCDVIFVTDTDYRYDDETAAERFYQNNGYGYRVVQSDGSVEDRGGILTFYSRSSGSLSVYVDGAAKKAFKGRGLYRFRQEILSAVYRGDSDGVLETYAAQTERYLSAAARGRAINPINWIPVLLAIGAGLLFGFIPVGSMKRQLTDVKQRTTAAEYMDPGSFVLTQNSDVLLNTHVTKQVHVVQSSSGGGGGRSGGGGGFHGGSSTHTSSSGGFHGGHSGKF